VGAAFAGKIRFLDDAGIPASGIATGDMGALTNLGIECQLLQTLILEGK
jgi:hypothetical protein